MIHYYIVNVMLIFYNLDINVSITIKFFFTKVLSKWSCSKDLLTLRLHHNAGLSIERDHVNELQCSR